MVLTGTPHFMLIDPDGKIIDFNAPRPSNPELTGVVRWIIRQITHSGIKWQWLFSS